MGVAAADRDFGFKGIELSAAEWNAHVHPEDFAHYRNALRDIADAYPRLPRVTLFLCRHATNKRRPHPLGLPNLFHIGARLGLVHAKHIATIAIEKS